MQLCCCILTCTFILFHGAHFPPLHVNLIGQCVLVPVTCLLSSSSSSLSHTVVPRESLQGCARSWPTTGIEESNTGRWEYPSSTPPHTPTTHHHTPTAPPHIPTALPHTSTAPPHTPSHTSTCTHNTYLQLHTMINTRYPKRKEGRQQSMKLVSVACNFDLVRSRQ